MFDKAYFDQKVLDLQEVASKVAFQIDAFQNDAFQSVISKILEGILASTGALVKMTSRIVGQGILTSTGTVISIKKVFQSLAGTLSSTGDVGRKVSIALIGALTSTGTVISIKKAFVSLAGTLTSTGAIGIKVSIALSGILAASGTLSRKIIKVLTGIVDFIGKLLGHRVRVIPITITLYSRDQTVRLYDRDQTVRLYDRDLIVRMG